MPKLTTEMVARLQGWAGAEYEWHFHGLKTSRYRQVGNAFPPPVARAIGGSIAAALRKEGESGARQKGTAFHDEVYRVLRERADFVTVADIKRALAGAFDTDQIQRRVDFLIRDFEVEVKAVRGHLAYRLGEWRAFRGQDSHVRHLAFAERRHRVRIS